LPLPALKILEALYLNVDFHMCVLHRFSGQSWCSQSEESRPSQGGRWAQEGSRSQAQAREEGQEQECYARSEDPQIVPQHLRRRER
jgi:hypothetical protein